jgi:hypothetical protein
MACVYRHNSERPSLLSPLKRTSGRINICPITREPDVLTLWLRALLFKPHHWEKIGTSLSQRPCPIDFDHHSQIPFVPDISRSCGGFRGVKTGKFQMNPLPKTAKRGCRLSSPFQPAVAERSAKTRIVPRVARRAAGNVMSLARTRAGSSFTPMLDLTRRQGFRVVSRVDDRRGVMFRRLSQGQAECRGVSMGGVPSLNKFLIC